MSSQKDIPISVIKKAKCLIDLYGVNLENIGRYKGLDVYEFIFPENTETGYPFLFVFDKQSNIVSETTGFEAFEIIEQIE